MINLPLPFFTSFVLFFILLKVIRLGGSRLRGLPYPCHRFLCGSVGPIGNGLGLSDTFLVAGARIASDIDPATDLLGADRYGDGQFG